MIKKCLKSLLMLNLFVYPLFMKKHPKNLAFPLYDNRENLRSRRRSRIIVFTETFVYV